MFTMRSIYITVLVVSVLKIYGDMQEYDDIYDILANDDVSDMQAKLIGGRTEHEGNIYICIAGKCGMMCESEFDHVHAEVICRMLGRQGGIAITNGPYFADEMDIQPSLIINSRCNGTEATLSNCKLKGWWIWSPCEHYAGVICDEPDIQVKLIGGRTEHEGNIDIFIAGRWGLLCDSDFHHIHAEETCRMLGYQRGIAITNGPFSDDEKNTTSNWKINSRCNGTEATLSNCKLKELRLWSRCEHYAGVICGEPDIHVRLFGGRKKNEGNIDLLIVDRWGSLCVQSFDNSQADVICRMLGHQRGIAITNGPFLDRWNTKSRWRITSRCVGTEATISNCKLSVWWQSSSCIYNAGVICGEPDLQVRLVGGRKQNEGNIDISITGIWLPFCTQSFDHTQADVICHMLGYQRGTAITSGPFLGRWNTKSSWRITSRCNGTEVTISNCKLSVWRQSSSCIDNAGVICGEPDLQVRLVGGWTKNEGNIDISIVGRWGSFCTKSFDHTQADVICRMLGHQRGIAITNGPFLGEMISTPNWQITSNCNRTQATISDCELSVWWQSPLCKFNAGAICGEPDLFSDMRLVGGNYENEGRIELNINGRWATICADLFFSKDAKVLCRFLRQPQSLVYVVNNEHFGKGNATMGWKIKPNCHGNETSLSECKLGIISTNTECIQPQAGVVCGNDQDVPETNQSGDHGIGISELIGGLVGVVSVAVLVFGVFIYCRRFRRVREPYTGGDAHTIQEPIPPPRRISSQYDEIEDADVFVNEYDTIGEYLELIDHYDQFESPDELSIADPNDGYLKPIVHGTGGESCEVTEIGAGDEDNPPNDEYLQPIVHGTGGEGGEVTESGDGDVDSPPNDVCNNDDGLMEMDIETSV